MANPSLSEQAYTELRRMIVRLDFSPGDVLREDDLRATLGVGRTPIREALQRLAREQFVTVVPRQGIFVSGVDVAELSTLFETRCVLEPYTARLAALRGTEADWDAMDAVLAQTKRPGIDDEELLALDRQLHEILWNAAQNRFLVDTLDALYAQSDRLWHLYLSDVGHMEHAVDEHTAILGALRAGDSERAGQLIEDHVRHFDTEVRRAVTQTLATPLPG